MFVRLLPLVVCLSFAFGCDLMKSGTDAWDNRGANQNRAREILDKHKTTLDDLSDRHEDLQKMLASYEQQPREKWTTGEFGPSGAGIFFNGLRRSLDEYRHERTALRDTFFAELQTKGLPAIAGESVWKAYWTGGAEAVPDPAALDGRLAALLTAASITNTRLDEIVHDTIIQRWKTLSPDAPFIESADTGFEVFPAAGYMGGSGFNFRFGSPAKFTLHYRKSGGSRATPHTEYTIEVLSELIFRGEILPQQTRLRRTLDGKWNREPSAQ